MRNILDYCSVNWEATSDNIRSYIRLNGISKEALAEAMCLTIRTVENWFCNRNHPSLDKLIFIAKLCNVDLLELIVVNGQLENKITECEWKEAQELADRRYEEEEFAGINPEYEHKCKEDVMKLFIFNEYCKSGIVASNLLEFLLFLPLIEPREIGSLYERINDNIGSNNNYVYKKVNDLINCIEDEDALEYVRIIKEFYLTYPSIDMVDDDTKLKIKIDKCNQAIKVCKSKKFDECSDSYAKRVNGFISKMKFQHYCELMLEIQEGSRK